MPYKKESAFRCRKVCEVSVIELDFNSTAPWCYRQIPYSNRTLSAVWVGLPLELQVLTMF